MKLILIYYTHLLSNNLKKKIFFIFIVIIIHACISKSNDKKIASVNNKHLFLSDLISNIPQNIDDSLSFIDKYIDDWIKRELLLSYAEMNIDTDLLNYEEQIDNYRTSLLIYTYQQQLVNNHLDTNIEFSEIKDYYDIYKDQFKLNNSIFKGRFIIIEKSAPNLNVLNKLYNSEKAIDFLDLEDYCKQFSKTYYLNDNKWQYFSVFNDMIPDFIKEENSFLRINRSAIFDDGNFRYYIFVKDYKLTGSISPIDIVRDKIKNVLLNKKKVEYLKQLEYDLFQEGVANDRIRIY